MIWIKGVGSHSRHRAGNYAGVEKLKGSSLRFSLYLLCRVIILKAYTSRLKNHLILFFIQGIKLERPRRQVV